MPIQPKKSTPGTPQAAPAVAGATHEEAQNPPAPQEQEEASPFEAYTPAEIAQAKEEMESMTPQDYLGMRSYVRGMEEQTKIPEAGCVIFTELVSPSGGVYHPTIRATDMVTALNMLALGIKHAKAMWGMEVIRRPDLVPSAHGVPAGKPLNPQGATQQQSGSAGESQEAASGTGELNQIVVKMFSGKMRTEFSVGKFLYPFGDSRDPKTIAKCFDADTGFTADHFSEPGVYTPKEWGNTLYVDWVKKGKYYNVVRVHY